MRTSRVLRTFSAATVAAGIFVMPAAIGAHDFWIEPSTFRASPGDLVRIGLRVGHRFDGDVVVRDPTRYEQFVVAGPDGVLPVLGQDAAEPAGLLRPTGPGGVRVIGYRSLPAPHWLEGHAFERYLEEEGLADVIEVRRLRGQSNRPGREIYSRSAKALIRIGNETGGEADRRLGLPLELVLLTNAADLQRGAPLSLKLLYLGAPVRGVLVSAFNEHAPDAAIAARTDAAGTVTFPASQAGMWLIKAVHMVPAPPGAEADWESFWASLTFEIIR